MSKPNGHLNNTEGAPEHSSKGEDHAAASDQNALSKQHLSFVGHALEGRSIRNAFMDGSPWFVAADVCRGIGLRSHGGSYGEHLAKLDPDEKKQLGGGFPSSEAPTPGLSPGAGDTLDDLGPDTWLVSESGLYTLILRSRAATTPGTFAHRFRRWVTHEVLPSIRATGSYALPGAGQPAPILANGGPEFRRIVTMVVGRRVYSYEQPTEMLMTEVEEIDGRLMAFGLSMAELHLLEVEQTVAMGMTVEGTVALNQLASTIRSGAVIAKRWLRARAAEAEKERAKMN